MLYKRKHDLNISSPIPFGEKAEEFFTDGAVDRAKVRECISSCTMCHKDGNVVPAPRYGTGYQGAKLAIIGQNPPIDEGRAQHGAWLAHFPDVQKGPHEKLVEELLGTLGVTPKELFATQAMKCPTMDNGRVFSWSQAAPCSRRFLQYELAWSKPKVILAFGLTAKVVVRDLLCYGGKELLRADLPIFEFNTWKMESTYDKASPTWVERQGTFIAAPHPSTVHRFITKRRWIEAIGQAYHEASTSTVDFQWAYEVR